MAPQAATAAAAALYVTDKGGRAACRLGSGTLCTVLLFSGFGH